VTTDYCDVTSPYAISPSSPVGSSGLLTYIHLFHHHYIVMLFCSKAIKSNHEKLQSRKSQAQITCGNLFSAGSCSKAANQAHSEYKHVLANILRSRYVARTPPLEARSPGRCSNVENAPRRRPVTGQPATPTCDIRRAMLRTPPSPAGH